MSHFLGCDIGIKFQRFVAVKKAVSQSQSPGVPVILVRKLYCINIRHLNARQVTAHAFKHKADMTRDTTQVTGKSKRQGNE
jgi:hypothetical protein